jgi:hypothetical protein
LSVPTIALTSSTCSSIAGRNSKETSVEPQDGRKAKEVRIAHLRRCRTAIRDRRGLQPRQSGWSDCEWRLDDDY